MRASAPFLFPCPNTLPRAILQRRLLQFQDPADAAAAVGADGGTFGEVVLEGHLQLRRRLGVKFFVGKNRLDGFPPCVAFKERREIGADAGEEGNGDFLSFDAIDPGREALFLEKRTVLFALIVGGSFVSVGTDEDFGASAAACGGAAGGGYEEVVARGGIGKVDLSGALQDARVGTDGEFALAEGGGSFQGIA